MEFTLIILNMNNNKHAFLIVAYNRPTYLDSLLANLGAGYSNRTNIYIHIDTKSFVMFQQLIKKYENCINVQFISQYNLHWGGYQIIEVERILLKMAMGDKRNFYFHLLSDTEFLCRPLSEFIAFFDNKENQDKEYIECASVEKIWSKESIKVRFFCWNIHDLIDTRKWHLGLVNRYFCKLQWLLGLRRPSFHYNIFYGGSSWWTVSKCGSQKLSAAFEDKNISKRFRFTYAPDEIFPSTVIGNSGLSIVSDYCLRNRDPKLAGIHCFRYIPWWKKVSCNIHPLTLTMDDYLPIKKSEAFFCRKIDPRYSQELLDKLTNDK